METLIKVNNLSKKFVKNLGFIRKNNAFVYALNDVSLDIYKGEILGIVGESGCGKSTLGRCILKLLEPDLGNVFFNDINISQLKNSDLKDIRKNMQIIFQNPYSSLNPRMKIKDILAEPLKINTKLNKMEINTQVDKMLNLVGLSPDIKENYPHEFSGGQRQRIVIAKALILEPEFVVADEPISALDISIQAQIIKLLKSLKQELNLTYLFISHDLSTVEYLCDRVAVMYLGNIVEIGTTKEIFEAPQHPYTQVLLNSIPKVGQELNNSQVILGEPPTNERNFNCCGFSTRCPFVMDICKNELPPTIKKSDLHCVKCFLYK